MMNLDQAKKEMGKIEKSIKKLKDAGCQVYIINNDTLVMVGINQDKKNRIIFESAAEKQEKSGYAYGSYNLSFDSATKEVKYDYEINIV